MQTDVSFRDIREFLRAMLGNRDLWLIVLAPMALDSLVGVRSMCPGGMMGYGWGGGALSWLFSSYNMFVRKWDSRDTDRALRPVRWALLVLRVAPQGDYIVLRRLVMYSMITRSDDPYYGQRESSPNLVAQVGYVSVRAQLPAVIGPNLL
jgi:hypothetical protein